MMCGAMPRSTSRSLSDSRTRRKLVVLEIAQSAVDELGRGRGRSAGQVVLFGEQHRQSASRGVARDAASVDTPADDGNVAHPAVRARVVGWMPADGTASAAHRSVGRNVPSRAKTKIIALFRNIKAQSRSRPGLRCRGRCRAAAAAAARWSRSSRAARCGRCGRVRFARTSCCRRRGWICGRSS